MPDETPPPSTPPTPTEELQKASVAFVMTLANATLTDRDAAWAGVQALMRLLSVTNDPVGVQKGIDRLKKINTP